MPARLADLITARVPDVRWAIVALALFAGLISAFIDNVATVLIVAPIASPWPGGRTCRRSAAS
jgi:Na+/H+ antiporter NhaD/arsenite permease-like protein